MSKRKSRVRLLLMSPIKELDFLQSTLSDAINDLGLNVQLDSYTFTDKQILTKRGQREHDYSKLINLADLIFVDILHSPITAFYEIGIANTIGKPVIILSELTILEDLPAALTQNHFITYKDRETLLRKIKILLQDYIENPHRFAFKPLLQSNSNENIIVDIEKLEQRDFENLCFELLAGLGYKQLEWQIKDEFVDAISTLRKQDPDGFEYDEFWLISFSEKILDHKMFFHEPDFFVERILRNVLDSDKIRRVELNRIDIPITFLFIFREKENYPKRLMREFSDRSFKLNRRGYPSTIRFRIWDEQQVTSLVQNNQTLAKKYFSLDALKRSNVRFSYEELYEQYVQKTDELQKKNDELTSERNRAAILERDAAWKLLSFTAAHRLGNPIDAIDSELNNLKDATKQGKKELINEIVESMETSVEKAKSIISQFRNLSIAHEIEPQIITAKALNQILKKSSKQAEDKKVNTSYKLGSDFELAIDVSKISECFDELIKNSLHHIVGENQQISITTNKVKKGELPDEIDKTKDYIKITFADNGCGVEYDRKTEIFKPFERDYVHGTGLGLSFCEVIIEKHGGMIREVGEPKKGAEFEIFLPVVNNKDNDD